MKKNFLALGTCAFALALGLAACDDSTSANGSSGDENPAEVSSSSILTTSSPTEDPGSSSSSVIPSTGSGQALSGGSAGVEGSSSSVTSSSSVESSSSVVSSSSEKSSSSVASSSSSAVSSSSVASSSSVVSSSSSSVILSGGSAGVEGSSSSKANWAYLNPDIDYGEFTDARDGQVYKTVTIGTQTWMAENLNYDPDPDKISSMGSHAWSGCYNNESANCSKYGRLYTWEVAMDNADCTNDKKCNASLKPATPVRGVCPSGWHLPSHYEFEQLINFIAPTFGYSHTDDAYSSTAGQYLKSLSGWNSSGNGSDAYGFSALPGGRRDYTGDFYNEGDYAYFWSSGEYSSNDAFRLGLYYDSDYANLSWVGKGSARSIRCLKD